MRIPLFIVPGGDFPPWAPWAFGVMGLVTVAVLISQAVRYFRANDDDNVNDDDIRDSRDVNDDDIRDNRNNHDN